MRNDKDSTISGVSEKISGISVQKERDITISNE